MRFALVGQPNCGKSTLFNHVAGYRAETGNFASVLTPQQIITFTIFAVFYIPCLAIIITIKNELGARNMWLITTLTVVVAMVAALAVLLIMFLI